MRVGFERVGLVAGMTGERLHGAPRRAATPTALSGSPFDQRSGR